MRLMVRDKAEAEAAHARSHRRRRTRNMANWSYSKPT